MPYSTLESLPDAVKKLPERRQRQWMVVWNSAYDRCTASGAGDCEQSAFAQAWGVVGKSYEEEEGIIAAEGDNVAEALEKAIAAINELPDSSFAYIEPGGEKDESGRTVPRSLRHYPLHDKKHVENALQRLIGSSVRKEMLPLVLAAAKKEGIVLNPEEWKSEEGAVETVVKIAGCLSEGLVYGVVYVPNEVDSQGDFASAEEIEKAAHDFLPNAVMNLHHRDDLEDVQVVESYLAPCDFLIEKQLVRKGSWVLVTKVLNEDLKKAIADGEITGYSLEGTASRFGLRAS